jgi:hypothetical protein
MKIYFDNISSLTAPNCVNLSINGNNNFWLTASGTRIKQEFQRLNIDYDSLDNLIEPGLYFIEVNGDPIWWSGLCSTEGGPPHILSQIPDNIISLIKEKKLKLIISADREGGGMIHNDCDAFMATNNQIKLLELPPESVLIIQGNRKIEGQYQAWLEKNKQDKLFDVMYSNHFDKIFIHNDLPTLPVIIESLANKDAKDFNSLNRSFKVHRQAHLYMLAISNALKDGIVSANEIRTNDFSSLHLLRILENTTDDYIKHQLLKDFDSVLKNHYPKFVDGDWSVNNAANSVNVDIFKNSLMSFVTETKFDEDVIFLTEKVFKCLAYGHPMIVLAPRGTLRALEELGFKTSWCGIDPSYNDIEDNYDRFIETHRTLFGWISLSQEEKISRINSTIETIQYNYEHAKKNNFYDASLTAIINSSKAYFNE